MAPPARQGAARASSSKVAPASRATSNGRAGPSRPTASSSASKKRPVQQVEEDEDEDDDDFVPHGTQLDMEDDDDADVEDDEDEDEDEDAFPELDSGSELGLEDEAGQSDDDSEDEEILDDEATGSESGYNTSDIEAMEDDDDDAPSSSTSAPPSPSSSSANLTIDEKLSRMIAKNSIKPNEQIGTDAQISRAKQGHGQLVKSKLVDGGFKREYEDVEAGYGSESSTEDVSSWCSHPLDCGRRC